ncbi:hypothetical protein LCGC14_0728190 [marine sediment metagenome]|uniref:Uncharacterized protein n=1 Tax=marine sediment metagenome TaxID=412755 RepID=A0A0F9SVM4_9ZZZZ
MMPELTDTDYIYQQKRSLLTWAVGALIAAMGDGFIRLGKHDEMWRVWVDTKRRFYPDGECFEAPTALQALIAGRVAILLP